MVVASQAMATALPGGLEEFPMPLESPHSFPNAIAPGSEGSIWFTESWEPPGGEARVGRIALSGVLTGEFAIPTGAQSNLPESSLPESIAPGSDGDMWFTNGGTNDAGENLIGRVTPAGGIEEFPIPSGYQSLLSYTEGFEIASGPDGDMWFTDEREDQEGHAFIGRITHSGKITEFPIPTGMQPNLPEKSIPISIALGADGNMWFTDQGTSKEGHNLVGRITPTGVIKEFPIPTLASSPTGIALGSDGDMWFIEPGASKVGRIDPTGGITEFMTPSPGYGIISGSDGNIWLMGSNGKTIERVTMTGEVTSIPLLGSVGPLDLTKGPDGNIWFIDNYGSMEAGYEFAFFIGRLITPYAPVNIMQPMISGSAIEGQVLSVSEGLWAHISAAVGYQWQICDRQGNHCEDLPGAIGSTYLLGIGDIGYTLRAVVRASDLGGSVSVASAPSEPVVAASTPLSAHSQTAKVNRPVVSSTMTWRFELSQSRIFVRSLIVHGLPPGGFAEVACHGLGCAFAHVRVAAIADKGSCRRQGCATRHPSNTLANLSLARLFRGHGLGIGARVSVSVIKKGWIGKLFVFATRKYRLPNVRITCLAPGSVSIAHTC